MMPGWIQDRRTGKMIPKSERIPRQRIHMIAPDMAPYESPVTGKMVDGKKERREDLARTGSRPYEKGELRDDLRRREDAMKADERAMTQYMRDRFA